ncbi:LacI family DNA-binding transcriptional regulator [Fusicatenibacter saccharivorans]|uniref:LacI family transcriptional regulator n=1 Tax=Fusicatenibacter saccharivorans TaxID=1150298 RepID=A0ABX2GBY1_9FIRM|nr:LacI family DNA-binding transcriptional regulator [Fusicatenibacter saccharivorans]NSE09047.1 LacI family transcriptional regulator [Fusicatenibacter saccharivorans]NSE15258.1 LacI family transcriptional regulator [Fusicatenibacter saccharivorans]
MIRIKDIADRAGVSPTTVSNVIHGKTGRVSKATVEKINRILKEMEYVPSISARMLANNSSGLIGVALGFMKKGNASSFEDPFVSAMLGNLEYQIREHGYYMMLVARHEQDDIMQQALGWNFDGMIAMALKEKEIAELSERLGKPLVTIDQYLSPELGVRSITMDDRGGAYQMSQYLIGKEHKKFLFLSDCDLGVDHYRWLGVRQAMEEAGIEDFESRHIVIPWNPEQREKAYEEMLPFFKKQTALFFSSDYYALEASNFLQNRGIKVPEEISIAGFDDVTYATLARPKLTTVHQMVDGKARRAVEVLMHLIQDEPVQKDIPPLPTTLVERESVRDLTK